MEGSRERERERGREREGGGKEGKAGMTEKIFTGKEIFLLFWQGNNALVRGAEEGRSSMERIA